MQESVPRNNNEEDSHMYPAEQTKLLLEVATFQRQDEADKTYSIEREADETMVGCEHR